MFTSRGVRGACGNGVENDERESVMGREGEEKKRKFSTTACTFPIIFEDLDTHAKYAKTSMISIRARTIGTPHDIVCKNFGKW